MRKKIAAGNWKMNTLASASAEWVSRFGEFTTREDVEVVLCVPFTHLSTLKIAAAEHIHLGAQNLSDKDSGAFTGEISGAMLKDIGVSHVIIGHSERREYFNETNELLAIKLRQALENGLIPIFCCGEPLEVRKRDEHIEYVLGQLKASFAEFSDSELSTLVIAYEPIWAIGTGETATPEQAQQMHEAIRIWLASRFSTSFADRVPILYGGSVKSSNAAELFAKPDIDGGLVGGASLDVEGFAKICQSFS